MSRRWAGGRRRAASVASQRRDPNCGAQRPLGMVTYGCDEGTRGAGMEERAGDGGFGEARIFESGLPDGGFFVEQQGGGHVCRGSAARFRSAATAGWRANCIKSKV